MKKKSLEQKIKEILRDHTEDESNPHILHQNFDWLASDIVWFIQKGKRRAKVQKPKEGGGMLCNQCLKTKKKIKHSLSIERRIKNEFHRISFYFCSAECTEIFIGLKGIEFFKSLVAETPINWRVSVSQSPPPPDPNDEWHG